MKNGNNLIDNQRYYSAWDGAIYIMLIIMIILIPIVFFPYCTPVFAPIKDLSLQILVLLGFFICSLKMIFTGKIFRLEKRLDKLITLYLFLGLFSLIWSVNIYNSLLTLPLFLAGPMLYFIVSGSIQEQLKIEHLLFVVIAIGTIMGVYGILQYVGIDFDFWSGNIGRGKTFGLFGNVNHFAEYMILPLSLAVGLILSKNNIFNKLFLFFAIVAMGGALFFTYTRGSYLAIVLTIPVILFLYLKSSSNEQSKIFYKKITIYFIIFTLVTLAVIYIPHPLNSRNTALGKLRSRVTYKGLISGDSTLRRIATWKFTWMMVEDRPFLGSGLGTFDYHTLKYQADFFSIGNNRDVYPHGHAAQAHNEYLQHWSELGIVGLILLLWIIFAYFRTILFYLQKMDEKGKAIIIGLAGGVTAVLIDAFFGFPLQLAASISLFWLFFSLTVSQINIYVNKQKANYIDGNKQNAGSITGSYRTQITAIILRKTILSLFLVTITIIILLLLIRPFMARVYLYHGSQQYMIGENNKAAEFFEKGIKWNPWQGENYYGIANILIKKNITQLALVYLHETEKYIDQHPLPGHIASLYIRRGEKEQAIPYLEKAIKYQSNKTGMIPLQIQLGNIYIERKDFKNAEHHFSGAIKNDPKNVRAYYGLAGAYLHQGKGDEAIEVLQKIIEIAPESKEASYSKTILINLEIEQ